MVTCLAEMLKIPKNSAILKFYLHWSYKVVKLRFNTTAGNPVKEILLLLNLPDHRSILKDSKEYIKMDMEQQSIKLIPYEVLKLKNIKKDGYTSFQYQEQYEHVGPEVTRSQEGKRSQDDDKRLCLVDDLKEAKDHIHIKSKIQAKA
ncbi:hypothetical protein Tco_0850563 [Tanacetum coccineum]